MPTNKWGPHSSSEKFLLAADEGHCRHLQRVKIQSTTGHVVWHTCIRAPTPKAQGPLQKMGLSSFAVVQMYPKRSSLSAYTSEQHLMDSSSYIYIHTHVYVQQQPLKKGLWIWEGIGGLPSSCSQMHVTQDPPVSQWPSPLLFSL